MKKDNGFTIIELLVTMFIMAILLFAGLPQLKNIIDDKNISVAEPILRKGILFAVSEAIDKNTFIQIQPIVDGADWSQGWKIEAITADGPELIREFPPLPGSTELTSVDFSTDNPLIIRSDGHVQELGSFTLKKAGCPDNVQVTYTLFVSGDLKEEEGECAP